MQVISYISHMLSIHTLCLYAQLKARWVWTSSLSVSVFSLGISSYPDIWLPICVELPSRSTLMETFCQAVNCRGALAAKVWANNTQNRRALTCHAPACNPASEAAEQSVYILIFLPFLQDKMKHEDLPIVTWEARGSKKIQPNRVIKAPWCIVMCWFTLL